MLGLLIPVACLVSELEGFSSRRNGALKHRLSSGGTRASLPLGMWELPGPGTETASPALAGGPFTIGPPGSPLSLPLNGEAKIWGKVERQRGNRKNAR